MKNLKFTRLGILRLGTAALSLLLVGNVSAKNYWMCAEKFYQTMPDATYTPADAPVIPPDAIAMWGFALDDDKDLSNGCGNEPSVPGPQLNIKDDDKLVVRLRNLLDLPVSLVIHGQTKKMYPKFVTDGKGRQRLYSLTKMVQPGTTKIYTWNNVTPGTYLYQSGTHQQVQVQMGLYGAMTKTSLGGEAYPGISYDHDVTMLFSEIDPALHAAVDNGSYGTPVYPSTLNYDPKYFLVNGSPYTGTTPQVVGGFVGGVTLFRMLNAGLDYHVPVINNRYMDFIAEDGNVYPYARSQYSALLSPGKTSDALMAVQSQDEITIYDRRMALTNAETTDGGMQRKIGFAQSAAPVAVEDVVDMVGYNTGDPATSLVVEPLLNDIGAFIDPTSLKFVLLGMQATQPGTFVNNGDGTVTYTPEPDFTGQVKFHYKVFDEFGRASNRIRVLVNVAAPNPALSVSKVLDSHIDSDLSTTVTKDDVMLYSVIMTNTGNVPLTNVTISDPILLVPTNTCTTVLPGDNCTLSSSHTVSQGDVDAGSIDNVGSVTSDQVPGPTTASLSTAVAQNPSMSIGKMLDGNADGDGSLSVTLNDVLTYSVTATNDGTVTLTNVAVSDPMLAVTSTSCPSVAPGGACVLTSTYTVGQPDVNAGTVDNTGSATSVEVAGPITANISTPVAQNLAMSVTKVLDGNADGDASSSVTLNDVLTYSVTATNDGTVTLTNVTVSDPMLAVTSTSCPSVGPGGTCVLTSTYTVGQPDVNAGTIDNTGSATSVEVAGPITANLSTPVAQNPSMSLAKVLFNNADGDLSSTVSLNDVLTYNVTATNDGTVTLTNVTVSDPMLVPNSISCPSVAIGGACLLSGTYTVGQPDVDAGSINNTGSATSVEVAGPVTANLVTPVPQNPSLAIQKVLTSFDDNDGSASVTLNDLLLFTITATNDGNVTQSNVMVIDPLLLTSFTNCVSVAPGGTCVLSSTYMVQAGDVTAGQIDNTGSANSDQVTVPVTANLVTPVAPTPP